MRLNGGPIRLLGVGIVPSLRLHAPKDPNSNHGSALNFCDAMRRKKKAEMRKKRHSQCTAMFYVPTNRRMSKSAEGKTKNVTRMHW